MPRTAINPPGLFGSVKYGFSQIALGSGSRVVTISGQVGWDREEKIAPGLGAQARLAFENLRYAMEQAGGSLDDVLLLHIYVVESAMGESGAIREALHQYFPTSPPASSWIGVPRLASPDFLVEIEAIGILR